MNPSVHDNFLVSYEVQCDARTIELRTEFRDRGEPYEHTTVLFSEVEAYHVENDLFGNIIFSVDEVPVGQLFAEHTTEIKAGFKYGWPRGWAEDLSVALRNLEQRGIRGFVLSSSYGMSGWVFAREMAIAAQQGAPADVPAAPGRR